MAATTLFVLAAVASACNIPVYRYAIERWKPDRYEFIVLHAGSLPTDERKLVDRLTAYSDDPDCPSNFALQSIDVAGEVTPIAVASVGQVGSLGHAPLLAASALYPGCIDGRVLYLLNSLPPQSLSSPRLVIRFPSRYGIEQNMWAGELDPAVIDGFLDSPARRELARRLLAGHTGVWLMIDSGNKSADDEAAKALTTAFEKFAKELKLPVLTDNPEDQLLNPSAPKLRVEFSLLRISREDAKEKQFIHTLLNLEEGLTEINEPIAFPIYGRGIALPAFAGKGITEAYGELRQVANFLVGPCSCQVKAQNPGIDLLATAHWGDIDGPKLPSMSEFLTAAMKPAQSEPAPSAARQAPEQSHNTRSATASASSPLVRNLLYAVGLGLLLLALIPYLLRVKKTRS